MINPKFTSHFIGIQLSMDSLSELFFQIESYIENHALQNVICPVRSNTLHITLYYLDKTISKNKRIFIKKFIKKQRIKTDLLLNNLSFFSHEKDFTIGYLTPSDFSYFRKLNSYLKENISHNHIIDNNFEYIPHCTIFRVKDSNHFIKHKKNIENIVDSYLEKQIRISTDGLFLYGVNSKLDLEKYCIYNFKESSKSL